MLTDLYEYLEYLDINENQIKKALDEYANIINKYTDHIFKYRLNQQVKIKASNGKLCIGKIINRDKDIFSDENTYFVKYLSGRENYFLKEKQILGLDVIGMMKERKIDE